MESTFGINAVKDTDAPLAGIERIGEDHWGRTLKLIADKYPYCTMHGVHVEEGCIVAYEGVQISFVFVDGHSDIADKPAFDSHWKALKALCAKVGFGRLAEIRFSRGRPVGAKMQEGGRRLRKLVAKADQQKERSPMS
jgi:hypothetical protein